MTTFLVKVVAKKNGSFTAEVTHLSTVQEFVALAVQHFTDAIITIEVRGQDKGLEA